MTTDHSKNTFLDYLINGWMLAAILIAVGVYLIFLKDKAATDEVTQ